MVLGLLWDAILWITKRCVITLKIHSLFVKKEWSIFNIMAEKSLAKQYFEYHFYSRQGSRATNNNSGFPHCFSKALSCFMIIQLDNQKWAIESVNCDLEISSQRYAYYCRLILTDVIWIRNTRPNKSIIMISCLSLRNSGHLI